MIYLFQQIKYARHYTKPELGTVSSVEYLPLLYSVWERTIHTSASLCCLYPLVLPMGTFKTGEELQSLDVHHAHFAGYTTILKVFITRIDIFHRSKKVHESCKVNSFIMPLMDKVAPIPQCTSCQDEDSGHFCLLLHCWIILITYSLRKSGVWKASSSSSGLHRIKYKSCGCQWGDCGIVCRVVLAQEHFSWLNKSGDNCCSCASLYSKLFFASIAFTTV